MKVIFDYQIFGLQNYGGISRYFVGLMNGLGKKGIDYELLTKYSNNEYLGQEGFDIRRYHELGWFKFSTNRLTYKIGIYSRFVQKYLINIFNKIYVCKELNSKEKYVFHPTYYDPYFLSVIGDNPFVLTVYDMVHEVVDNQTKSGYPIAKWKRLLAGKANKIIAISNNTKNDLIKILGVNEKKIKVVYLHQSLSYRRDKLKNILLPDKYILFVGDRAGYKNFSRLLQAFKILADKYVDLNLVCAGGQLVDAGEYQEIGRLGLSSRIYFVRFSSNQELVEIYSRSLMFVFPSIYEGFGIPLLEAFECKTPVVCSNTSSFPEIVENAALMFDPKDTFSMVNQIEKLYLSNELRVKMIKLGIKRAKFFSKENMVRETVGIYKSIVNE